MSLCVIAGLGAVKWKGWEPLWQTIIALLHVPAQHIIKKQSLCCTVKYPCACFLRLRVWSILVARCLVFRHIFPTDVANGRISEWWLINILVYQFWSVCPSLSLHKLGDMAVIFSCYVLKSPPDRVDDVCTEELNSPSSRQGCCHVHYTPTCMKVCRECTNPYPQTRQVYFTNNEQHILGRVGSPTLTPSMSALRSRWLPKWSVSSAVLAKTSDTLHHKIYLLQHNVNYTYSLVITNRPWIQTSIR